jgi:ferric-dicitrate binding protein FerR (iron transport regulator)
MIEADQIGQLVRLAGRRPMPDDAQMARARAAALAEWSRLVERRSRSSRAWVLTAAALAAGAAAIAVWLSARHQPVPVSPREIATVERLTGTLLVTSAGQSSRSGAVAARIGAGDRLETLDAGRAAFSLDGGISIRLDRGTTAALIDAATLELERGAVYVDTGTGYRGAGLRVITPLGVVRHVGTQFEVRLEVAAIRVRVREGEVALDAAGHEWTSGAGESLLFAGGRGPERLGIATSGPEWNWIGEIARPFRLEGATVRSFLDWVSRESGWRWEYADPAMRARVDGIVLHGSIDGLLPEEALAAVLPTCGLTSRREGDRLVVTVAQPSRE